VAAPYRCAQCGELYASQSPPAFSTKPAMRKEHRIAIARHFHNRMAGSFCLGKDERNL
jgi:rRNA maturation protein Nop10